MYSNETLRQLQLMQLEILKEIDQFCETYNIRYSLYAGTLLGAVRHQGFIPWDDDLDICMSRREYNRFINLWNKRGPKGYIIQNKENTPAFSQSFTKIRKDNTTFLQDERERGKYHTGIFVDIFPIDRMPAGILNRLVFLFDCMLYQLYTREYIPCQSNALIQIAAGIILKLSTRRGRQLNRKKFFKKITRNEKRLGLNRVAIETMRTMKQPLRADLLDEFVQLRFEDQEFPCFKDWDDYLKCKFGDYMLYPPKEEQTWRHHPIILDFTHNYDSL